jgi:hypothetical protein
LLPYTKLTFLERDKSLCDNLLWCSCYFVKFVGNHFTHSKHSSKKPYVLPLIAVQIKKQRPEAWFIYLKVFKQESRFIYESKILVTINEVCLFDNFNESLFILYRNMPTSEYTQSFVWIRTVQQWWLYNDINCELCQWISYFWHFIGQLQWRILGTFSSWMW